MASQVPKTRRGDRIEKFLETMASELDALGFRRKAGSRDFCSHLNGNLVSVHFSIIGRIASFDVVVDFASRIEELEQFIALLDNPRNTLSNRPIFSIGAELGNLMGSGQKRWHLEEPVEFDSVARSITEQIVETGLPYLDRISTTTGAYRVLSQPGREGWIHSPIHLTRCKKLVALAALLNKGEDIVSLETSCRATLQSSSKEDATSFDEFMSKLASHRNRTFETQ